MSNLMSKLVKYHYASFFSLAGLKKEARELADGEDLSMETPSDTIEVDGVKFYILNKGKLGLIHNIKYCINTKVFDFLSGEDCPIQNFKSTDTDKYSIFVDGTMIIKK